MSFIEKVYNTAHIISVVLAFGIYILTIYFLLSGNNKNLFTCAGGNTYDWCNRYVSQSNMTVIGYENSKSIVQYNKGISHYCDLHHDTNEYLIGYKFDGYYMKDNYNVCVTKTYRDSFIKEKDFGNRLTVLIPIFIFLFFLTIGLLLAIIKIILALMMGISKIIGFFNTNFSTKLYSASEILFFHCHSPKDYEDDWRKFENMFNDEIKDNNVELQNNYVELQSVKIGKKPIYTILEQEDKFLNIRDQLKQNTFIIGPAEDQVCIYCQHNLNENRMLALPCNHWYHVECFKIHTAELGTKKYQCPLCLK